MIDLSPEILVVLMFGLFLLFLFIGYPLGMVLAGIAVTVGYLVIGPRVLYIIYGQGSEILLNYTLIAVPLFVFMGVIVQRSGIGEELFRVLEIWLHKLRGHLAVVVILTGTALAACTGIIAGSIVMLSLLAIPPMMSRGYNKELACGVICASGILGILIPPSIMLVVYGPMAQLSVGKLFMGAIGPGLLLATLYISYILIACRINPNLAPSTYDEEKTQIKLGKKIGLLFTSVLPLMVLILAVLGSIFFGVAAPTEAAAVGAFAALLLAILSRKLNWRILKDVVITTGKATGMIGLASIGAITFMAVLLALGGREVITQFLLSAPGGKWGVFAVVHLTVFILGMFMDWLGIVFIVVPVVTPIAEILGFDPIWFALMICLNLQSGFMSPPVAYSIFYLRGSIPDKYGINTGHIIRGVIPFIIIVVVSLFICVAFPEIILWLPNEMIKPGG